MTWPMLLVSAVCGAVVVLLVLARKNAPPSTEEWDSLLSAHARQCLDGLELRAAGDGVMAADALQRAMRAKNGLAFEEAIRLIDISCTVLEEATQDRVKRLQGMALAVRMASAILPPRALQPTSVRLFEVRTLFAAGRILHHMLVTGRERLLLRVTMLRFGYLLTVRAMCRGSAGVRQDPTAASAWARCDAALKDWTVELDPALLDSFRSLLADARAGQRA